MTVISCLRASLSPIPGALITCRPVDGYSCPARVEVLEDKNALSVMFVTLEAFNILKRQYCPEVETVITDSGAEFGSGPAAKNKGDHPFERLLPEWPANTATPGLTARKLTGKRSVFGKPLRRILSRMPSVRTLMT